MIGVLGDLVIVGLGDWSIWDLFLLKITEREKGDIRTQG